jgi:hypothetical protein
MNYAVSFFINDMNKESCAVYEKILTLYPDFEEAVAGYIRVYTAKPTIRFGPYKKGLVWLQN